MASTPADAEATSTPIAQLSPAIQDAANRCVRGVVVLLWPFSSHTKQLGLLLSEPDFRLRRSNGQVRVTLQGPSAEEVAKSKLGIGDTVLLRLDGVSWEKKPADAQAFDGELDWRMVFTSRLVLEIFRHLELVRTIDVDSTLQDDEESRPDSPEPCQPESTQAASGHASSPALPQIVVSPFHLNNSSAFNYVDDDGYIFGKGRKRTKFGRLSSEWVFLESPPSPTEATGDWSVDDFDVDEAEQLEASEPLAEEDHLHTPAHVRRAEQAETDIDKTVHPHEPKELDSALPNVTTDGGPVLKPHGDTKYEEVQTPKVHSPTPSPAPGPDGDGMASLAQAVEEELETHVHESIREMSYAERAHFGRPADWDAEFVAASREGRCPSPDGRVLSPPRAAETPYSAASSQDGIELVGEEYSEGERDYDETRSWTSQSQGAPASGQDVETGHRRQWIHTDTEATPTRDMSLPSSAEISANEMFFAARARREVEYESASSRGDDMESDRGSLDEQTTWRSPPTDDRTDIILSHEPAAHPTGGLYATAEEYSDVESEKSLPDPQMYSDMSSEGSTSVLDETEQPPFSSSPTQPEVIVIDSSDDDESKGPPEASPGTPYRSSLQDDTQPLDQPNEVPEPEGSMRSVSREDMDLDQEPGHTPIEENQSRDQSRIESATETTRIWVDGCAEEAEQRPSYPIVYTHVAAVSTYPPPLDLGSIPYRTTSCLPEKRKWRSTLHVESQMMTPAGTQESVESQQQHDMPPPLATAHDLPTPQFSQQTRSFTGTFDASEVTMSFDDSGVEALDNGLVEKRPVVLDLSAPPQGHRADLDGGASPMGAGALIPEADEEVATKPSHSPPGSPIPAHTAQDEASKHDQEAIPCWPVKGLWTRLSYFTPFSLLSENFNNAVDTMSVVISSTLASRGSRQPRDYFTTLLLIDPSTSGTPVCAQLFRKKKSALPVVSKGDVILLRNFKVRSADHKMVLCTMGHSSWAVFIQGDQENVQINGPPVEYGDDERACVAELRQWFSEEGAQLAQTITDRESTTTSISGASDAPSASSFLNGKNAFRTYRRERRSRGPNLTVHELRRGRRYTDTSRSESVHELRNGTMYAHS